ncbi:hypothetical protein Sgly_3128 [Syntrophobotulus glycolicus DSM 8271]|uniref:Uncharacterized protein n=1 Tax=Syntrophobotulus glycolicus (strain DSM 8271 / FlGlyR) TaxID=645991 RepID=F0SWP5_SYNGF|nr:hypothetical protein [Syntrophobotulus glycolicus]ADY54916.1 hypothetical protein Sgly_0551 [Syntrophobotulus glycolicus DSM 8271]ADY56885.1 hypothetical protein Sgly_2606 [Syntrophobotulus glycolicus DSM 8271]ADY57222.1 hypothetical protein Sgly_2953 [Syntrophobotulus glycolicus DSM 8271]ADY57394.1 hypothetical protein Sgly_3128 [Syntrophobotulus glycolicus DSM 8271]
MIFVDDSSIKVSGVILPGLIKSIEVRDDALIEEQTVEGSSAKAKQAEGYEDAKVTIELILEDGPNATRKEKLDKIQNLFKKAGQEKPVVHEIINEHTAARRVKKVIFKSLSSKEESKKEQLTVSLEFWSYNPMTITATKSKSGSSQTSTSSAVSKLDPAYQSYLSGSRGTAPKTNNSPAVDDVSTTAYANRLSMMPY